VEEGILRLVNKDDNYFEIHLIPKSNDLWKIENFEKFVEERKRLIADKFKRMELVT